MTYKESGLALPESVYVKELKGGLRIPPTLVTGYSGALSRGPVVTTYVSTG